MQPPTAILFPSGFPGNQTCSKSACPRVLPGLIDYCGACVSALSHRGCAESLH